jgi:hypothetical protein
MMHIIDPTFSTKPIIFPWQTGVRSSLTGYATKDGDESVSGGGGPDAHVFTALSPNVHPIPASESISTRKTLLFSQSGITREQDGPFSSLYDLIQFSIEPQTGLRSAVSTSPGFMPFELSTSLYFSGQLEYVQQHVDHIIFCPYIMLIEPDLRNAIHSPGVAVHVRSKSIVERKLLINLCKQVGIDPNGDLVLEPRPDFEIFPDIVEGAARLHIMSKVLSGDEPAEHLELSYIRKNTIPLQISAIDTITAIYERDGATEEAAYVYLKNLKKELAAELKQLRLPCIR